MSIESVSTMPFFADFAYVGKSSCNRLMQAKVCRKLWKLMSFYHQSWRFQENHFQPTKSFGEIGLGHTYFSEQLFILEFEI